LKDDTLPAARICRQPTEHTPIWLMRQAGRYLPEYNATRARAGCFLALAEDTDASQLEVTAAAERFPLDAQSSTPNPDDPDAMGLGLGLARVEAGFERR